GAGAGGGDLRSFASSGGADGSGEADRRAGAGGPVGGGGASGVGGGGGGCGGGGVAGWRDPDDRAVPPSPAPPGAFSSSRGASAPPRGVADGPDPRAPGGGSAGRRHRRDAGRGPRACRAGALRGAVLRLRVRGPSRLRAIASAPRHPPRRRSVAPSRGALLPRPGPAAVR